MNEYLLLNVTTMMINLIVTIGFVWTFNWIKYRQRKGNVVYSLMALVFGLVLFYHVSAVLNTAVGANGFTGYEWLCMIVQLQVIYYALLYADSLMMTIVGAALMALWFQWMPHVVAIGPFSLDTLLLLVIVAGIYRFGNYIKRYRAGYYLALVLFAAPFYWSNAVHMHRVALAWPVLVAGFVFGGFVVRYVHIFLERQRNRSLKMNYDANYDSVTQLRNFRRFNDDLQAAYTKYSKVGGRYIIMTMDIDRFKSINDTYGHLAGNEVLQAVAVSLKSGLKSHPLRGHVYRTGGEEFTVILHDVPENLDGVIAEDIRSSVAALNIAASTGALIKATVSIGVAAVQTDHDNANDVYSKADQYLYRSKQNGRNAVTLHGGTAVRA